MSEAIRDPDNRKTYRKGAVGALMDEYERASEQLARLIVLDEGRFIRPDGRVRELPVHG